MKRHGGRDGTKARHTHGGRERNNSASGSQPARAGSRQWIYFSAVSLVLLVCCYMFFFWWPAGKRSNSRGMSSDGSSDTSSSESTDVPPQLSKDAREVQSAVGAKRIDSCILGSLEQPGAVQVVDIRAMAGFRLPGDVRCPLVIQGLSGTDSWNSVVQWADLKELERRSPAKVTFDASADGEFAYWDNNSLLAARVREVGVKGQGYAKVTAPREKFFAALARSAIGSVAQASPFGAVRFGGKLSSFSQEAAQRLGGRLSELAPEGAEPPSLWLSSAGSFSTAHFDSFHNTFIMVGGEKQMLMSPSADLPLFEAHPGTHPLARQARRHFGSPDARPPQETRVVAATVRAGEAIFIPAGWLHHVVALKPAVSISWTALPPEHHEFNNWMVSGPVAVLPFMGSGGEWTIRRVAAALRVFTPVLLAELGFGGANGTVNILDVMVNASYGLDTRRELGWTAELPTYPECYTPTAEDRRAAHAAAKSVAARFLRFQEELRILYIVPYLETALSKVGGSGDPGQIMERTMAFAQTCLRPTRSAK